MLSLGASQSNLDEHLAKLVKELNEIEAVPKNITENENCTLLFLRKMAELHGEARLLSLSDVVSKLIGASQMKNHPSLERTNSIKAVQP